MNTMVQSHNGITTTHNGSGEPSFLTRISGRAVKYLAQLRAERQLNQLDDRLLMDIGLKRSDIHRMVWDR